jgi:hypothetical protein
MSVSVCAGSMRTTLIDHVDLELAAQVVERHALHRPRHHGPGAVHHGVERLRDRAGERFDLRGIRDVEEHWVDLSAALGAERFAVGLPAHAGDDVPASTGEMEGGGATDAARGAGDENARHLRNLPEARRACTG